MGTHDSGSTLAAEPRRWHHAATWLEDFSILSWRVDPEAVARTLPAGFEVETWDGGAWASMVSFRDVDFHFRGMPLVKMTCGQVNYRTYVRRGDQRGVWFYGSSLDSRLVHIPRALWRMPWHRTKLTIERVPAPAGDRVTLVGTGGWGGAELSMRSTGTPYPDPVGFDDPAEGRAVLLDPFHGWYRRLGSGRVGHYRVWHEPLALSQAEVDTAQCSVFTDLALVTPGQLPDHAGEQQRVFFDVFTPPDVPAPR
ncbi:MAG: DUF2071 domain-containing protein [Actinomycetota bacterium]